jgi:hypothetical protein
MIVPRSALLGVLLAAALAGCGGARSPARDATFGVLDALQRPPREDRLANDLRTLVQRYAERALASGPPEDLGALSGRIAASVLREVERPTPELRALVHALVGETLQTGIVTVRRELLAGERQAPRVRPGAILAQREISTQPAAIERAPLGEGPIARGLSRVAEETAGATVRGAAEGLRAELPACADGACRLELVRGASRSMVQGALEGVQAALGAWIAAVAIALGAVFLGSAALVVWAVRRATRGARAAGEPAR